MTLNPFQLHQTIPSSLTHSPFSLVALYKWAKLKQARHVVEGQEVQGGNPLQVRIIIDAVGFELGRMAKSITTTKELAGKRWNKGLELGIKSIRIISNESKAALYASRNDAIRERGRMAYPAYFQHRVEKRLSLFSLKIH